MWDLNKVAIKEHQNAVAHGRWEEDRSFGEVIALCHLKLSEALKEYRIGRPLLWYACGVDKAVCVGAKCAYYGNEGECDYKKDKPEGVAVKMIDCLLQILDYAAKCEWDCKLESRRFLVEDKTDLPNIIAELHASLAPAWVMERIDGMNPSMAMFDCAEKIITWLEANYGDNWQELLEAKHEYNKKHRRR